MYKTKDQGPDSQKFLSQTKASDFPKKNLGKTRTIPNSQKCLGKT